MIAAPARCGDKANRFVQRGTDSDEPVRANSLTFSQNIEAFFSKRSLRVSFDCFPDFADPADFHGSDTDKESITFAATSTCATVTPAGEALTDRVTGRKDIANSNTTNKRHTLFPMLAEGK